MLLTTVAMHAVGQSLAYFRLIQKGENLYRTKHYKESALAYSKALAAPGGKAPADDRYNAACAWARAGNKDSALHQLQYLATNENFKNYKRLTDDTAFTTLHPDKRWVPVCNLVKQNKERADAKLDKALVARLEAVLDNDQKYRMALDSVAGKYGLDSKEMEDLWKAIERHDSLNEIEVLAILEKYSWPTIDMVGEEGTETVFLVIQHSPLKVQDKYLPILREEVKKGNAKPGWLALLEDRVATRHGGKQIYGTQVMGPYILPMIDPANVDKRRAAAGIGPLSGYLQNFGMAWDIADYQKQLPGIEAMIAAKRSPRYQQLAMKAYELYNAKQFREAALAYNEAFASIGGKTPADDRYNAACSWALAGNTDSALHHLQCLATKANYKDYDHLLEDTDLVSLHTDKRWEPICKRVKQNKEKSDAKLK